MRKKPGRHLENTVIIQVGEDVGLARDHRGKGDEEEA